MSTENDLEKSREESPEWHRARAKQLRENGFTKMAEEHEQLAQAIERRQQQQKLLGGAIQVSRAVGWRKLVPLLAVGILAAGVGMELFGRDKPEVESDEQNGDRELARAA